MIDFGGHVMGKMSLKNRISVVFVYGVRLRNKKCR